MISVSEKLKRQINMFFILAFSMLPFLKILTGAFNLTFPIYYVPLFLALTLLTIFTGKITSKFFAINTAVLFYIILGHFSSGSINLATLKVYIAAIAFFNAFYFLYRDFSDEIFINNFKKKHVPLTKIISYLLLGICFLSFIVNIWIVPLHFTTNDLIDFLKFDRSSNIFRYQVLLRFNPVGLIQGDISNIRYIGQQLLLLPFSAYIISKFSANLKRNEEVFLITSLAAAGMIVNSRGLILAIAAVVLLTSIRPFTKKLHTLYTFAIASIPVLIIFIRGQLANGRTCQLLFTKDHISIFGNGIGAHINQLNSRCSELTSQDKYKNIVTISFDNIHLELLHYFGILVYLSLYILTFKFLLTHNNPRSRVLGFLVFGFLSLNFNLFEFILLPTMVFLIVETRKKVPNPT